jgi:DNA-directed RNA polymerase subunit B
VSLKGSAVVEFDGWPVIEDILRREGVARQHLNSYNDFIEHGIQAIVDEVGGFDVETQSGTYHVKFGKVEVGRPQVTEIDGSVSYVTPMEARLRNLTYAAPIYLEFMVEDPRVPGGYAKQSFTIGYLPVMVRSKICVLNGLSREELVALGEDPEDPGGYFIVNGSERVIVGLEDLSPNMIFVAKEKNGTTEVYRAIIHSSIVGFRSRAELVLKSDGSIYARIPLSPVEIPFVVLMKALGVENDREIADMVSRRPELQELLEISFEKAMDVRSQKDALIYIGNRVAHGMSESARVKKVETLLDVHLLPHLGRKEGRYDKALYLAEAASRLLELKMGWIEGDDRDHYGNKIVKLAGELLADVFRTAFRNLVKDMKYQLSRMGQRRGISAVGAVIKLGIITDKLNSALATGNWGKGSVGITQLLDRTNYLSTLSHLRRVQSPLSRSQPNFDARELHPTQFGRMCPVETPEGSNCGLVKNLALYAVISVNVPEEEVLDFLYSAGVVPVGSREDSGEGEPLAKVLVNGRVVGYTRDPEKLVSSLRRARRKGELDPEVSVYLDRPLDPRATFRVYIFTHAGRVLRPLVLVEGGRPKLTRDHLDKLRRGDITWRDLLRMGVLELLDANEEENAYIAMKPEDLTPEHTHLELYPPAMLGVVASIIPYPEHNQSPRNTYESAMGKQALGFPHSNYFLTLYSRQHLLVYPQKPLVRTKIMDLIGLDRHPVGQNAVVAVLSYDGYNIEDAIVVNRASIERGLGRSFFYRTYEAVAQLYPGGSRDKFEVPRPEDNVRGYRGEKYYRLLEPDGAVMAEAEVSGGDVLIGKTSPPRFIEEYREAETRGLYRRDSSVALRPSERGVVDTVILTQTVEGYRTFRVRVRDQRVPELGDKFASRHGQKGVIGMIVDPEDMPYTEDGVVPDIIVNPHAFPSRMTVGQFLESIAGKAAALRGRPVDATAFSGEPIDDLRRALLEHGFKPTGKEVMYDGRTGRRFEAEVFIGVVYYHKLHHMVADKIHARARGQVQMLTKQPTEGRARGGGLRFGEMERDCLIAYGASMLLRDRLLEESDKTEVYVCERCGYLAYYDRRQQRLVCRVCGENAKISKVTVAYAFKLLLQEIMSLGISPRLQLGGKA